MHSAKMVSAFLSAKDHRMMMMVHVTIHLTTDCTSAPGFRWTSIYVLLCQNIELYYF